MEKKTGEQEFQQKYVKYNIYRQQAEGLLKEISVLNQTAHNLGTAREVLENIDGTETKSKIIVPIGGSVFLKAKLEDTENVLVGIGADVIVKKPIAEAIEAIGEQLDNLKKSGEELGKKMKEIDGKMRDLEPEMQKMLIKAQKSHGHEH